MKFSYFKCQPGFWLRAGLGLTGGFLLLVSTNALSQTVVTTLANTQGTAGPGNAVAATITTGAKFKTPAGITLDPSGSTLFLADYNNNAIRWVTSIGNVSSSWTYTAFDSKSGISHPIAIAIDAQTNIFVLNYGTGKNGNIIQFSGSYYLNGANVYPIATNATHLTNATSFALDTTGHNLYITVESNKVVRLNTLSNSTTTVGVITNKGTYLRGLVTLSNGQLAITDSGNNGIWKMDPSNTNLDSNSIKFTGFHGPGDTNGSPTFAAFNRPENIAKAGNDYLVVADYNNNKIKVIDPSGNVTRLFGTASKYWKNWSNSTKGWNDRYYSV